MPINFKNNKPFKADSQPAAPAPVAPEALSYKLEPKLTAPAFVTVPAALGPSNPVKYANEKDHLKPPTVMNGDLAVGHSTVEKKTSDGIVVISDKGELIPTAMAPATDHYKVAVGGSQTVNLGNYESVKISVTLSAPSTKDTLDDTYEFASDWVSEKIAAAVAQAKKGT